MPTWGSLVSAGKREAGCNLGIAPGCVLAGIVATYGILDVGQVLSTRATAAGDVRGVGGGGARGGGAWRAEAGAGERRVRSDQNEQAVCPRSVSLAIAPVTLGSLDLLQQCPEFHSHYRQGLSQAIRKVPKPAQCTATNDGCVLLLCLWPLVYDPETIKEFRANR